MSTTSSTTNDTVFVQMCLRIIKEQENIVGTLSWDEAGKVEGLSVIDRHSQKISITGDPKKIINDLVDCYVKLFGRLSREVSREAVADITAEMPQNELPESLK